MRRFSISLSLVGLFIPLLVGGAMQEREGSPGKIRIFDAVSGRTEEVERIVKSDAEWKKILTPEQYRITRQQGTEAPFAGACPLPGKGESGLYQCVGCGTDLFRYESKFESGTGWPSFWEPVSDLNIRLQADNSLGVERTEVLCARCGAHLGHVFDDGPAPTGKRYCINAAALRLVPVKASKTEKAAFAAGCFWGVEEIFRTTPGVVSTRAGYTGGTTKNPTYEEVSTGKTGHAESVEVTFDPEKVSYEKLLEVFWSMHDPTQVNHQGPDEGSQYRTAIFYYNEAQEKAARLSRDRLQASGTYKKKSIATEIVPVSEFYPAEDYHQKYFQKRGIQPVCHIR